MILSWAEKAWGDENTGDLNEMQRMQRRAQVRPLSGYKE